MELGQLVWFDTGQGYLQPGEIIHSNGPHMQVRNVTNQQIYKINDPRTVRIRHDLIEDGIEDTIQLRDLHEGSLLMNLSTRYRKQQIYTYIGSILIAVNPYKMFDIYGLDMVTKYEGQLMGLLPPHLFAIGSGAHARIMKNLENQCIIISGESGAGKTESTKLIMQYLAAVSKSSSNIITEQILEANPLLESFGNAKTIKNDNSSRFGKYIEVFFRGGVITGAKITDYLLEKSRIVHQAFDERNYHIFYEMILGMTPTERAKYGLSSPDRFFYLNQGGSDLKLQNKSDAENFGRLVSAMEIINFSPSEQDTIFSILSSILHLGNIIFDNSLEDFDSLTVANIEELLFVAKLLQLPIESLERALTFKLTETREEKIFSALTYEQACDSRDGIAKVLYASLFSWLVGRINNIVCQGERTTSIAILDIFGFEDFKVNSFEQLCINYANEKLQYYFNQHIFKLEQIEYAKEKIDWTNITFTDNQPCIELISSKPYGIIHILDDESNFPRATDKSFLDKCHKIHGRNPYYSKIRLQDWNFVIQHYAGKVVYDVTKFLDKNRDMLKPDVVNMLIGSKSKLISQIFHIYREKEKAKTITKTGTMKRPQAPTVAAKFHESLVDLIDNMSKCNPYFIRCIKPNQYKQPMVFDHQLVLEQLRYSGMLETISIRKNGYPIRLSFSAFSNRYRCLGGPISFHSSHSSKDICIQILNKIGRKYYNQYQLGVSKVFMREALETTLEYERSKLLNFAVIVIQKNAKAYLVRKQFLKKKKSVIVLQKHARRWSSQKNYKKMKKGFCVLQAFFRAKIQRRNFLKELEMRRRHILAVKQREKEEQIRRAQSESFNTVSPTTSSVSQLEVPYDLAFLISKLQEEGNFIHTERNLIKVVGPVTRLDRESIFPKDIDLYPFSKFAKIYFKSQGFGMVTGPLFTSLLKLNDQNASTAIAIFMLVQRFIGDLEMDKEREQLIGNYIVQKCLLDSELRDEVLCQICNQTWQHPDGRQVERAWLLMATCLSSFSSSEKLYKYLLKYVSDHAFNGYKMVCQHKLLSYDSVESGVSRTYPPCLLEWKANRNRAGMALSTKFADLREEKSEVDSWTTGQEFAGNLLKKRGVREGYAGWSVWLQDGSERYELAGYDYVLDLISEMEIPENFPVKESHFLVSSELATQYPVKRRVTHAKSYQKREERDNLPPPLDLKIVNRSIAAEVHQPATPGQLEYRSSLNTTSQTTHPSNAPLANLYTIPEPDYEGAGEMRIAVSLPPAIPMNGTVTNGMLLPDTDYNHSLFTIPETSAVSNSVEEKSDHSETRLTKLVKSDISLGTHINNVPFPSVNSQQGLENFLDNLFEPVLSANTEDLGNASHVEKLLRGGGNGPPGPYGSTATSLNTNAPHQPSGPAMTNQPIGMPTASNANAMYPIVRTPLMMQPVDSLTQQQLTQQAMAQQALAQQTYINQLQMHVQQQAEVLDNLRFHPNQSDPGIIPQQRQQQQQERGQPPESSSSPKSATAVNRLVSQFQTDNPVKTTKESTLPLTNKEMNHRDENDKNSDIKMAAHNITNLQLSQQSSVILFDASTVAPPPDPHSQQLPQKAVDAKYEHTKYSDRAKTIRLGKSKFVWPPPKEETVKKQKDVSRLDLVENISKEEEDNIRRKQKPTTVIKHPAEPLLNEKPKQQQQQQQQIPNAVLAAQSSKVVFRKEKIQDEPILPPPSPPLPPPPPPIKVEIKVEQSEVNNNEVKRVPSFQMKENPHEQAMKKLQQKGVPLSPRKDTVITQIFVPLKPPSPSPPSLPPTPPSSPPPLPPSTQFENQDEIEIALVEEEIHAEAIRKLKGEKTHNEALYILKKKSMIMENDLENKEQPPDLPPKLYLEMKEVAQTTRSVSPRPLSQQDIFNLEQVKSELFPLNPNSFYTYNKVPWQLHIRKEAFFPNEKLENPDVLNLVYCQVVKDTLSNSCIRITKEEKRQMREKLDQYNININNMNNRAQVKKEIIEKARGWPVYFCRLFPVLCVNRKGQQFEILGISDKGIQLVTRERDTLKDHLAVVDSFGLNDIQGVTLSRSGLLNIVLMDDMVIQVHTFRAHQIKSMLDAFTASIEKDTHIVRAVADYLTQESTLLSFHRGDIIKLIPAPNGKAESGWLYGILNGKAGSFPSEYVISLPAHGPSTTKNQISSRITDDILLLPEKLKAVHGEKEVSDGKFSMIEFASRYFRESLYKYEIKRKEDGSISGSLRIIGSIKNSLKGRNAKKTKMSKPDNASVIEYSKSPIPASLLKHESKLINKLALECFIALMRLMGDYPMKNKNEQDCVYFILDTCLEYKELCDEVYCQLCKQTTNNTSAKPDSCIHGWKFFAIFSSYFKCSSVLKPYLMKYLQSAATGPKKQFNGTASVCLGNLRKIFKYGGRKIKCSTLEVKALMAGRNHKRQQYVLPGGIRTMMKTKTCTVASDVIEELCYEMEIYKPEAIEEFGIFAVVDQENVLLPIDGNNFIIDVTTDLENQELEYYLLFRKLLWNQPLKLDNSLYLTLIYNQLLQDYLGGYLLIMENGMLSKDQRVEIAKLGAVQHKASDAMQIPTLRDVHNVVPSFALNHMTPQQWVNMIHQHIAEIERFNPKEARVEFIRILSHWRLFGSSFFTLKHASDDRIKGPCLIAINKNGVQFLEIDTHKTLISYSFLEIVSTRRLKSQQGKWFLDLKCGNLMVQKVIRMETDQGLEISEIIGKHIQAMQALTKEEQVTQHNANQLPSDYTVI